jgi:hypothetical protein
MPFKKPLFPDAACARLRGEIAFALGWRTDVEQKQAEEVRVGRACADEAHGRDAQTLLKDLARGSHRSGEGATYVGMVGSCGNKEARRLKATKDRLHHRDVGQVRATRVRVVEDGDVARAKLQRRHGRLDRHGHRAEMHRHVVAHGDDAMLRIEDGTGIIATLFNIGGDRRSSQRCTHLFRDGVQGALEHGKLNGVD